MLHQSELHRGSVAAHNHCMYLVGAASTLHLSARRQRRARTLSPCSPRTVEHRRKLAPSVGASWRLRCGPQSVQVLGRGSKHSHAECKRQRRARTLRPPPPCTVQHPQACSISESVMAAPLQTTISAGAWSRWQAICTRVPKADTSTHLASASTLHRAALASLLHQ